MALRLQEMKIRNYLDPSVQLLPDTLWVKFKNDYEPVPASCSVMP